MKTIDQAKLKKEIRKILKKQGYEVKKNQFSLAVMDHDTKRSVHDLAKEERIEKRKDFISRSTKIAKKYLIDGNNIDVRKIKPRLIEVLPDTEWEVLFRWWNLVWWSLPYERAYGRQMRYIVWDQHHKSIIGLIGLQSPILSWSVRDKHLGIPADTRDYWVNQSLSAQRLGAVPPYNSILGGKLVAYLVGADLIRRKYAQKYADVQTVLQKRDLPPRLLFITTTGAYGKSSVYTRLKYNTEYVAKFIGYSHGSGSFHISNDIFDKLVMFLDSKGYDVRRGYGSGPSRKLRLISQALNLLGFENGSTHGIRRAVYLFPFVKNLSDVIKKNARPKWYHHTIDDLTAYWKQRWAIPKSEKDLTYKNFNALCFFEDVSSKIDKPKKLRAVK